MSSFRHPVGPEQPSVYWRRRAVVVGVLLLVVVVVVLIVVGRGSAVTPAGAASTAPAASGTPSAGASSGAGSAGAGAGVGSSGAPSSAASPRATPSAGASASAGADASGSSTSDGGTCSKDQIELTPVLDKTSYGPTEDPEIAMSITNSGSSSCHMDLGSAQQVLTISSGQEQYWSSKDCQTGGTNQDVTIKAGQTLTTPSIEWDRTRSSKATCDSSRASVTAGGASYHLSVGVGNLESAKSVQFILE